MLYNCHLKKRPFNSIKSGKKTIEIRLNDEKRKQFKIGDFIEFENLETKEKILTEIINLHRFNNFEELYNSFDKSLLGYNENDEASPKDMQKYYSLEDEKKYGVLGIEIKIKK